MQADDLSDRRARGRNHRRIASAEHRREFLRAARARVRSDDTALPTALRHAIVGDSGNERQWLTDFHGALTVAIELDRRRPVRTNFGTARSRSERAGFGRL